MIAMGVSQQKWASRQTPGMDYGNQISIALLEKKAGQRATEKNRYADCGTWIAGCHVSDMR